MVGAMDGVRGLREVIKEEIICIMPCIYRFLSRLHFLLMLFLHLEYSFSFLFLPVTQL